MSGIREIIEDIWHNFDKDGNGYLNRQEANALFKLVFNQLNREFTQAQADQLFNAIDKDHNGNMTKGELIAALENA